MAAQVFAAGQPQRLRGGEPLPRLRWCIAAHRLFQPQQIEWRHAMTGGHRFLGIPGLVGIDHQHRIAAKRIAHVAQVGVIALRPETDLELEGAVALVALGQRQLGRIGRIDARRIDRHRPRARTAEHAPDRLAGAPREQVPHCHVDAGGDLVQRAGLAGLQHQHGQPRHQRFPDLSGRGPRLARHDGPAVRQQQARSVFGAYRREIAPDLAPAFAAIAVGQPDQHRGSVSHDAERGLHRRIGGGAQDEGIEPLHLDRRRARSAAEHAVRHQVRHQVRHHATPATQTYLISR